MDQNNAMPLILTGVLIAASFFGVGFFSRPFIMNTEESASSDIRQKEKSVSSLSVPATTTAHSMASTVSPEVNTALAPFVRIVAPKGGETACLGQDMVIRWNSFGLRTVRLWVQSGDTSYSLGTFPASFNEIGESNGNGEYVWRVGEVAGGKILFPEGYANTILIDTHDGVAVSDKSNLISIVKCSG